MRWMVSFGNAMNAALLFIGGYLTGDFDFESRGEKAVFYYLFIILSFVFTFIATATYPGWNENDNA